MENSLLFEHLICENIDSDFHNVGAAMYNACQSEQETYCNGFKVGKVNALLCLSLENLLKTDRNLSADKKETIKNCLDSASIAKSLDEIDKVLQQLKVANIVF
ncbi:MAG: hypothetical protein Q4E41_08955 [Bacteroidales bacterium]|nr:hypothetical protein [Bacteroidales bacterium]